MSVTEEAVATRWVSDVAFEGVSTGDGRYMNPGSLRWREPPLTLMAMIETPEFGGHAGAMVAGRMDAFIKDAESYMDGTSLPDEAIAVRSHGTFDTEGDRGSDTARMVEDETMRGISVDLAVMDWCFRDPETGELIDPETATEEQWEQAFMGELEFCVLDGEIMAATVCPTPAFAEARIAILATSYVGPGRNVWLNGEGQMFTTLYAPLILTDEALTAASAPLAPIAPPLDWFQVPEPNGPTPMTFLPNGQVYGHIALWDTCHTGYLNGTYSQCIRAPRSNTSYAHFHLGEIVTEEGMAIPCGKLTFDTGHAPINLGPLATRKHYDDSGACGAFVRAKDGQFGIWVCGAVKSNLSPEGLRDMRACPPSGDWRSVDHNLELMAALAVPSPGLPVPRSQLALAASASGDIEVTALILTGMVETDTDPGDEDGNVQMNGKSLAYDGAALAAVIEGGEEGLHALIEG